MQNQKANRHRGIRAFAFRHDRAWHAHRCQRILLIHTTTSQVCFSTLFNMLFPSSSKEWNFLKEQNNLDICRDEFWDLYKNCFHQRVLEGNLRICLYGPKPAAPKLKNKKKQRRNQHWPKQFLLLIFFDMLVLFLAMFNHNEKLVREKEMLC